jgi:elongation factor Ts
MKILAKMVGELRERTGAGLLDCKKALAECDGDGERAVLLLRKKGIASADKRIDRQAQEGTIFSYIHTGGRIGVLLQLCCETDFVAKNEQFQALGKDICLHIAAANPTYVAADDVPEKIMETERELARSQVLGKPPHAMEAIVNGKLEKFLSGVCLLLQPFVKNPEITVGDLIREHIGRIGENIRVARFARHHIGA